MKILVTGAAGFVGKNLIAELRNRGEHEILAYDADTGEERLDEFAHACDFVFHLAGVNRPRDNREFDIGNRGFTAALAELLKIYHNNCPVVMASSTQAELDNPYGRSKKAAEDLLFAHAADRGNKVMVYRLPNVFGKWCRPNYNSAVATFCHNIARGLPIQVNPDNPEVTLVYIDDLVSEFIAALGGGESCRSDGSCFVPEVYTVRLHYIVELLQSFRRSRADLSVPDLPDPLTRKLYSTYLSYMPDEGLVYPLQMNADARGSFTEFLRTVD
ncbi:MAG: NAD-dependent epimerase/dehydratase family protein, partial [Syntrophomonadaceae bacterium]|nr:NAD-dependent epimerase/dehydratase family protein [Syntrophomonadaceae bacterium]